jgi:hypothetical protein
MALGKDPYRRFCPPDLERLRESVSVLAERVYLHLALGRYSRASNATRISLDGLRVELREHSRAKVEDALQELQAQNWLCIDWMTLTVWLPMQAQRCASDSPKTRQGYLEEIAKLPPCAQRTQAYEFAQSGAIPYGYGIDTVGIGYGSKKQKKKQKQEFSSAIATEIPPAIAVETRLALPLEEEPPPFDWNTVERTVADPYPDDAYRPPVRLTPEAQARIDRLKAEKAQQTLTLTPPKPSKTLTPGQLDAIFAKKRMAATVDLWNELLGKTTCGPCSHKEVAKMATQLMSNLAKYVSSDVGHDGSALIGWAKAKSEYHSGRAGRTWTLQQWLSAEHLSLVFADYRNERGDERKIRYLPERTLTDWRLAVEAQEAAATQSEAA